LIQLSVNLNKVALLRNSRGANSPGPLTAARTCIDVGANGITLHLREDRRHALESDVRDIRKLCADRGVEFNLEGDPRPELVELALEIRPSQFTLVPVTPGEITSNHGWDLPRQTESLIPSVRALKAAGVRVAVFLDADPDRVALAAQTGADRIEIYTEPYGAAFGTKAAPEQLQRVQKTARAAAQAGLGVNAGHDLNLYNLPALARAVPEIQEVSIGHALIADALYLGLAETVGRYLAAARGIDVPTVRTE
jgi:pyridoxine 5-phosphate synthase